MTNNSKNLLLLAGSIAIPLYVGICDIINRRTIDTKRYVLGIVILFIGILGLLCLIYELQRPGDMVISKFKTLMYMFFGSLCSIFVGYREILDKEIRTEAQVILDYGLLVTGIIMMLSFFFILIKT